MEDGMALHLPLDKVGPQAVLNGRPAKPQGARRMRHTLRIGRRETRDRERRWAAFANGLLARMIHDSSSRNHGTAS